MNGPAVVTGARQTGKSTLAEVLAPGHRRYLSLLIPCRHRYTSFARERCVLDDPRQQRSKLILELVP